VPYLRTRSDTTGRIGAVGFCFGGGVVNAMAVRFPDLAGAVPYYGAQPAPADVAKIKAPLLIHYASEDPNINKGWPAFEDALKASNVRYEMYMYPNTQHGFHNDTTPRYDEAAAKLSWQRTVEFFQKTVNG
jgi:carboxymethylenebutenolidase